MKEENSWPEFLADRLALFPVPHRPFSSQCCSKLFQPRPSSNNTTALTLSFPSPSSRTSDHDLNLPGCFLLDYRHLFQESPCPTSAHSPARLHFSVVLQRGDSSKKSAKEETHTLNPRNQISHSDAASHLQRSSQWSFFSASS